MHVLVQHAGDARVLPLDSSPPLSVLQGLADIFQLEVNELKSVVQVSLARVSVGDEFKNTKTVKWHPLRGASGIHARSGHDSEAPEKSATSWFVQLKRDELMGATA